MLLRNLGGDDHKLATQWQDLGFGAPTIIGFANLCSLAMCQVSDSAQSDLPQQLSGEAKTILVAAAKRGTIDIRADRDSFDSAERFLAVCVEVELDHRLLFLQKENPEQTIRFLEGFRQLCQSGLVMHHLQKDFSLSASGFAIAKSLKREEFVGLLEFGMEIEH
jgi:hypothetical protein